MGPQQVVMVLGVEGWTEGFTRRGGEREGGRDGSTLGADLQAALFLFQCLQSLFSEAGWPFPTVPCKRGL